MAIRRVRRLVVTRGLLAAALVLCGLSVPLRADEGDTAAVAGSARVSAVVAAGFARAMAAGAGAGVAPGPLTPIANLMGRTDGNGSLVTSAAAYSGTQGPLTPIGQLRGRTDANGSLLVALFGVPTIQVTAGNYFLHSNGGGGGGGSYENTALGYQAGNALAGTGYANTLIGNSAGKVLNGTAGAASSNTMVGYFAGIAVTTGSFNTLLGTATGASLTTQSGVTHVGYHAGNRTSGTGNTCLGQFACRGAASIATGISNTAIGDSALTAFTTANSSTAVGISALEALTSGANNTALGAFALRTGTTTTAGSIGVGYFAGAYETAAGKFFVNNQDRTNESGDRTLSLLYGVMAAAAANQSLTINGQVLPSLAQVTAGSATGLTVSSTGEVRTTVYKVIVDRTAFVCAAVTCDLTIGTLPANTWLMNVTASLTTTFACASTCTTSTLSAVLGKGAGGAEYLASADIDAATAVFGDADAEMGTLLTRAAAIQGGTFTSGSQAVVLRVTSGTGNIGTGAATNFSQGSVTLWLTTRTLQ